MIYPTQIRTRKLATNRFQNTLKPNCFFTNSCRYVAPPPSRPKYNNYEWQKAQNSLQWVQPTSGQVRQQTNYNQVLSLQSNGVDTHLVPAIAIKYVPNVGNQYYAVVPKYYKIVYVKNDEDIYQKYDKVNGKYNPKYKKYKNYEKVKYIPVQLVSVVC